MKKDYRKERNAKNMGLSFETAAYSEAATTECSYTTAPTEERHIQDKPAQKHKAKATILNRGAKYPLFPEGKTAKDEYIKGSLIDILTSVPWGKISIPLYTYKDLIMDNTRKNNYGTSMIGYIKNFDAETETFDVIIFGASYAGVEDFEDPIIFPRVAVNNETHEARMVLGLDLCPMSKYAYLLSEN